MAWKRGFGLLLGVLVFTGLSPLQANDRLSSYVQFHYSEFDDAENNGFGVAGSWKHKGFRLFGGYTSYDFNDVTVLGGGYAVIDDGGLQAELGLSYQDYELADDGAVGAHLLLNHPLTPSTTLTGKLGYLVYEDIDDQPLLGIGAHYQYTDEISAFANFEEQTERRASLFRLGVRYGF